MQKTAIKAKSSSSYSRPTLQKSTTLSRKYVRRPSAARQISDVKKVEKSNTSKKVTVKISKQPAARPVAFKTKAKAAELPKAISVSAKRAPLKQHSVARSQKIQRFNDTKAVAPAKAKPAVKKISVKTPKPSAKIARPSTKVTKPSAKARADKAADRARAAIQNVATMESTKPMKRKHTGRTVLAFVCSAIAVVAIGLFVAINMPNISVKVAAINTGIDAEYPEFVPRNYSMETVASDKDGKITMKFVGPNESSFVLTEEKSTWDSTAVLNNFVKPNYSANYSTMHEQGITYYTEAGSAAWVNGGVLYKLTSYGENLSKEQIRNLVVSL